MRFPQPVAAGGYGATDPRVSQEADTTPLRLNGSMELIMPADLTPPGERRCCAGLHVMGSAALFLVLLCAVTTLERVSFKMLVDLVVPFRYMVVVVVVAADTLLLAIIVPCRGHCGDGSRVMNSYSFPRSKLLVIAFLDLLKLYMMTLPAAWVAPTLTVMLLQGHVPVSMLMGRLRAQPLQYTTLHCVGASIIALSLLLALLPVLVERSSDAPGVVWNTIVYLLSCVPASASTLYKEKAMMELRQPLDPYLLNLHVDLYQLLWLFPLTPVAFRVQFMGVGTDDDPPDPTLSQSMSDGFACLLWGAPPEQALYSPAADLDEQCSVATGMIFAYLLSTLLVNFSVDRVLTYGSEPLLYRAVSAATLTAFVCLGLLSAGQPTTAFFGLSIAMVNVPSAVLLLLGNELYHRHQEPGTEVMTQWLPPQHN